MLDENVAKKELQEIKIKENKEKKNNKNEKEKKEEKVNDIDYSIYKGKDRDKIIIMMVNQIMNKKRAQKINSILNGIKIKYYNEEKEFIMPEIKYALKKLMKY